MLVISFPIFDFHNVGIIFSDAKLDYFSGLCSLFTLSMDSISSRSNIVPPCSHPDDATCKYLLLLPHLSCLNNEMHLDGVWLWTKFDGSTVINCLQIWLCFVAFGYQ